MAAVLTRGLTTVRAEFNTVFPERDKTSDGWIGDQAHVTGTSGHNQDKTGRAEHKDGDAKDEVRAIDVDRDLVPGSPIDWMELVIQLIVSMARSGVWVPFRYVIYKGRIWNFTEPGVPARTYTGGNKHDKHAHLSGGYSQKADEWTGRLGLQELRDAHMPLNTADRNSIRQIVTEVVDARVDKIVGEVIGALIGDVAKPDRSVGDLFRDLAKLRGVLIGDVKDTANARLDAGSPLARLIKAADIAIKEKQS